MTIAVVLAFCRKSVRAFIAGGAVAIFLSNALAFASPYLDIDVAANAGPVRTCY